MAAAGFTLPVFPNGPVATGIAASSDVVYDAGLKIHFQAGVVDTPEAVQYALRRLKFNPRWSGIVNEFVISAMAVVVTKRLVDRTNSVVTGSSAASTMTDASITALPRVPFALEKVITLIVASKVTFVMMNHHVGQNPDRVEGYAGKVLDAWDLQGEAGMREALWMAAHWFDTKRILHELDYADLSWTDGDAPPKVLGLDVQPDVRMRIQGGVAGAGKFLVYNAILDRAKMSAYALVMEIEANLDEVHNLELDIRLHPLRYHVGSRYLTGLDQKSSDLFSEMDRIALSAYIRVAADGSTLAKSPNVMDKADVEGTQVFTSLVQMRQLLTKVESLEVLKAVLKDKGVGRDMLAVKSGFITEQDLKDAEDKVAGEGGNA